MSHLLSLGHGMWSKDWVQQWRERARKRQRRYFACLGWQEWPELTMEDCRSKIAFAIFGPPTLKGYAEEDAALINELCETIYKTSATAEKTFRMSVVYICVQSLLDRNTEYDTPLFRVWSCRTGKAIYVDLENDVYDSFRHWHRQNRWDMCLYCHPYYGYYSSAERDHYEFDLEEGPHIEWGSPPCMDAWSRPFKAWPKLLWKRPKLSMAERLKNRGVNANRKGFMEQLKYFMRIQVLQPLPVHIEKQEVVEDANISKEQLVFPRFFVTQFSEVVEIGRGSQGEVAAGLYRNDGTKTAFKTFTRSNEGEISRNRELLIIQKYSVHKNIVRFLGMLFREPEDVRACGYVMEFVDFSMHTVIHEQEHSYALKDVIHWFGESANGLNYLHQNKVIHRDIKPGNILISSDLKGVRICDFGSSLLQTPEMTGGKGTFHYMAPELFKGTRIDYDSACDVYSYGISLWEAFHRRSPYEEMIPNFDLIIQGTLRPVICSVLLSGLMKNLVTSCWDNDPRNRPSMDRVAEMLEKVREVYRNEHIDLDTVITHVSVTCMMITAS